MTRNLMATSAATVLSVLLAMPASAQGQDRQGRGDMQAGENMRGGGGEMRGGGNMRAGSGEFRGGNQAEFRGGGRAERGAQARGQVRAQATTEGTIGRRDNVQRQTRVRSDARIRGDSNVRLRGDSSVRVRGDSSVRLRGDSNIRTTFRDDRRDFGRDDWRFRDRTRFSVGLGFSDPYYAYGYDDSYYAYGAAQPYGYRRPLVGAYESYAASPGCTCAPGAYGGYAAAYDSGWGWGSSWHRGRDW